MKRLLALFAVLFVGTLGIRLSSLQAADPLEGKTVQHNSGSTKPAGSSSTTSANKSVSAHKSDADGDSKPVGGKSGEKGGIYVVGRGFKTAGHEMEKGFKAAGRGIVKGGKATGRGFKKAGHSIHDFFTGEKSDEKK